MEFQVGMRFFQVLSDLRIREIELVEISKSEGWDDGKTRHWLQFLPVSRKGAGLRSRADSDGTLNITEGDGTQPSWPPSGTPQHGVLLGPFVFTTVERAHAFAVAQAERNVRRKQHDLAKARSRLVKAEAVLRAARKAAE